MSSLQSTAFNVNNSHFEHYKLGDLLQKIVGGGTPSKSKSEYWNGSVPWASVKDMADGVYQLHSTIDSITSEGVKNSATNVIPKDIVVISTRMGLGRCFRSSIDVAINQDLKALFPNEKTSSEYLIWLMVHLGKQIENMGTGTTVKGIRLEQLKDLDVYLPPLPTQRKIAAILSAYDDLIENNTKRIKILEEMAQTIYNEWFVKFRFPGHENVKMVDSELGMIPEGWEVKILGEVCVQMQSGGTPSRKRDEFWDAGNINWYKTMELWDKFLFSSYEKITSIGLKGSSAKLYEPGTILMAIYGSPTVGRLGILTQQAACNQAAIGMVANPVFSSQQYLFYTLYNLREYFNSIAQGAAQQNISKAKVAEALCVLPSKSIMEVFTNHIVPIWGLLQNLQSKNNQLRNTRDLLLPRLISGEIDVSELDINVEEITA